ncbi:Protein CNPPD1 [Toxocara canis]|uniref:Protein CNPPD1 n=1 Tax=Toxocara canis TaxID=6265 RepID=A0A0B2W1B2_TOXCA|nr:Protein CNPPD1 [Toxocara canis]
MENLQRTALRIVIFWMAPRSLGYKQVQQRMRRSLKYGSRRMRSLSLPLSELLVDYFDKYAPYDYMDMDFATSLARESCVDACTFLVAMVYVDRVRHADKLYFETSDPGEIYLSALVVASKYLYDGGLEEFVYNDEWAISAGRPLKRVNELELELLDLLSWNISVDEAEFSHVLNEAECWVAREAMLRQGFCTYNEAAILGNDSKFLFEALKSLLSILAAVMLLYSALAYSILLAPRLPMSSSRPTNASMQRITLPKWSVLHNGLPSMGIFDPKQFSSEVFGAKNFWLSTDSALSAIGSFNVRTRSFLRKDLPWSSHEYQSPLLSQFNRSATLLDAVNVFTCSFV